jgi:hypothetical protein
LIFEVTEQAKSGPDLHDKLHYRNVQ